MAVRALAVDADPVESATEEDVDDLAIEDGAAEEDEASAARYDLLTYPADWTLEVIHAKWRKGEVVPAPMQRGYVWTQPQASLLIESFLMQLPVPPIYVYRKDRSAELQIVDGLQRVLTICGFFEGKFLRPGPRDVPFRLRLGEDSKWNGLTFEELGEDDTGTLENSVLRAFIMRQVNPDDSTSIYHVFERLNTGGTQLTPQEVRNCVYHGPFSDLLREMNQTPAWRDMLANPKLDRHSRDVELVLRCLALATTLDEYAKPMKRFLTDFMSRHDSGARNDEFRGLFDRVVEDLTQHLPGRPFHLHGTQLNVAALDATFAAFAGHGGTVPSDVARRFEQLKADTKFADAVTVGTTADTSVRDRIVRAKEMLFGGR